VFEVNKELLDSHEALLEVVFDDSTLEAAKQRAARHVAGEVNIPGFRRGKAPYAKVVQYVGEATIVQEAAESLLDENYVQILAEAGVAPYGSGEFVDMSLDPLTVKLRVALQPDVQLGDYRELREDWEDPTVSQDELDQVLEQLRQEHAVLEPVERPAELGDEVEVNVHATVDGDVVVDEDDIHVVLSEERPFLSPEFVETLVGTSAGEERQATLKLPETIEQPELRGVDADFALEVTQVYARQLPELDDALASTVGSFETFDELVDDIRARILNQKREQAETAYRDKLLDKLVEQAEISYPPQMISETLDDIVAETRDRLQRQGSMSLEDALRLEGRTLEQFREEMTPQAERRVKRSLVLSEFAEQEGLEVSENEVVAEYGNLLQAMGVNESQRRVDLSSELARNLRSSVLGRKVMQRLAAIGRGEVTEEAVATEPEPEAEAEVESEPDVEPEVEVATETPEPAEESEA